MGSTQICRGFTDVQWKELRRRLIHDSTIQNDEDAWKCAITVFERRIEERFLSCIESLQDADSRWDVEVDPNAPADCSSLIKIENGHACVVPGFAVMALCCLLMETLQSFIRRPAPGPQPAGPCRYPKGNCIKQGPTTNQILGEFLQRPSFKGEFSSVKVSKSFVKGIRNGILHNAKTRNWLIWRNEPHGHIVGREGRQHCLNRIEFYEALKKEFNDYVRELHDPLKSDLRRAFIDGMDSVVESC